MIRSDGPSQCVTVTVQPFGAGDMPHCRITPVGGIPVMNFGAWPVSVDFLIGNVDDAADYLRRLSRTLAAFAAEVDAAKRDERMPEAAR